MVILRLGCPNRMVTKGYRKGVYEWVGSCGDSHPQSVRSGEARQLGEAQRSATEMSESWPSVGIIRSARYPVGLGTRARDCRQPLYSAGEKFMPARRQPKQTPEAQAGEAWVASSEFSTPRDSSTIPPRGGDPRTNLSATAENLGTGKLGTGNGGILCEPPRGSARGF